MYAKHRVDHDIQYKESCIDENQGLVVKGKRTQYTNTPYSFLFCSEYLKQRLDRKSTQEEVEQDAYYKNKQLTVKPETRDASCGNFLIRTSSKKRSGKHLKRISTVKRIKRLVVYKRVYRTMKQLEHLFKVSKSKWEIAMAKASEENIPDDTEQAIQTSQSSSAASSDVKVVMTASDTAITAFDIDMPKVSESSPAINTNVSPLISEEPAPDLIEQEQLQPIIEEALPVVLEPAQSVSSEPRIEMKDVAVECYLKKKRKKSATSRTTLGFVYDLSSIFLKELQGACKAIPKMSYLILVTFYALP